MRSSALVGVLVGSLLLATAAHGQPTPESTRLFEEGRALAKAGKHAAACDRFAESYALVQAPGTALNRGDCLEKLGQLVAARAVYAEALGELEAAKDARAAFARQRVDAVTARLVVLKIAVAEPALPGLVVELDGEPLTLGATIAAYAEPGTIEVSATAPGHEAATVTREGGAGQRLVIELPALVPTDAGGAGNGGSGAGGADEPGGRRKRGYVLLAAGAGAGGVIALGISGVLGLSAKGLQTDAIDGGDCTRIPAGEPDAGRLACNADGQAALDRAGSRADVATVLAVGGGLLVGTAIALYVLAPREALAITPAVSATSVGLELSARF